MKTKITHTSLLAILLLVLATTAVSGQTYQPTPYERIQAETAELYRIGGEHEVRAYADREPCLSVHREGGDLVIYWWCERFKMIEEAHRIEGSY